MDQSLHGYIRVGLVLEDAFPESHGSDAWLRSAVDAVVGDPFFGLLEVGPLVQPEDCAYIAAAARAGRVGLVYNAAAALRERGLSLSSLDDEERDQALTCTLQLLADAAAMGAERVNLHDLDLDGSARDEEGEALFDSLCAVAAKAGGLTLSVTASLCASESASPLRAAAALVATVREMHTTVALALDVGAASAAATEKAIEMLAGAASPLGQVYLSPLSPLPSDGAAARRRQDGQVAVLRALFHAGYIGPDKRQPLILRVAPHEGEQSSWAVAGAKRVLLDAWTRV